MILLNRASSYCLLTFRQYLSFEYLGIVLKGAPHIPFIIIYRPPKYSPAFVEEFTELLSMISSEFDCFAITGDFNIHTDNAEIKTTKEIITALNTFDLIRHVHGPTHNRGQTLDLLISRGLNISSIVINDVALSDHFCIFFDRLISVTTESRSVSVRDALTKTLVCYLWRLYLQHQVFLQTLLIFFLIHLTQKLGMLLMILLS